MEPSCRLEPAPLSIADKRGTVIHVTASTSDYVRGAILVALLAGSLFPPLWGINLAAIGAAGAAIWVACRFLGTLKAPPGLGFLLLVFAVLALPLFLAPSAATEYGATKIQNLFSLTLVSLLAATMVRDRAALVGFARAWTVGSFILAVGALTGVADSVGRAAGLEDSNPIWLARAIATGLVFLTWLAGVRGIRLLHAAPVGALLILGIFATGSRGPLLGAAVGVLIVLIAVVRATGVFILVGVIFAGTAALWLSPAVQNSRIGETLISPNQDVTGAVRIELWRATWAIIRTHPLGVGYGNWELFVPGPQRYPHNLLMEATSELGWLVGGFIAVTLVVVVTRLFRGAVARNSFSSLVLAVLLTETVAVSVSGDINARTWWFMLLVGWNVGRWRGDVSASPDEHVQTGVVTLASKRHRRHVRATASLT